MGYSIHGKRAVVEDCECISIFFFKEHGYLDENKSGVITWSNSLGEKLASIGVESNLGTAPYIRISYTITHQRTGEKSEYDYKVLLARTDCNFGGFRYWFICPACNKRVANLYSPQWNPYYGCRHCNDLSYRSRNEPHSFRAEVARAFKYTRKADELYEQLRHWGYNGKLTRKAQRYYAYDRKGELTG